MGVQTRRGMSFVPGVPRKRESSLLSRWLEPLASGLWILFLLWTGLILLVWLASIGDVELERAVRNPDLRGALQWCLRAGDSVWMLLACANCYLALAAADGLTEIRKRAAITLAAAWAVSALSAEMGVPLGAIHYTTRLGVQVGPVPFGTILLWFVVVFGARSTALHFAPRASHMQVALFTGVLAALSDLNFEAIAWKVRVWWLWYPALVPAPAWPPQSNFLTWLLLPMALAYSFRGREVVRNPAAGQTRPAMVFGLVNGVFLLAHFALR
jgi:uncharacterized membrane protein